MNGRHERDYLERTIETVRNHHTADNCWPQWANIFADEIEHLWRVEEAALDLVVELGRNPVSTASADRWLALERLLQKPKAAAA